MEKQFNDNNTEQSKFVPEPEESFGIEFLNAKGPAIREAMSRIGNFIFRRSGPKGENEVYF